MLDEQGFRVAVSCQASHIPIKDGAEMVCTHTTLFYVTHLSSPTFGFPPSQLRVLGCRVATLHGAQGTVVGRALCHCICSISRRVQGLQPLVVAKSCTMKGLPNNQGRLTANPGFLALPCHDSLGGLFYIETNSCLF